jgi:hypothetical protein
MSVPALELSNSVLNAPEAAPDAIDYAAVALAGLQAHFGDCPVLNYDCYERRDYKGPASNKERVSGALVVNCWVRDGDGTARKTFEINDANRPFNEDVITALGAGAPVRVRDIVS